MAIDAEVLLSHSAWLTRLARALVARADEIDDIVQETFVHALSHPPRHEGNLRAWLVTIARNIARSRFRSDQARIARENATDSPPPVENPAEALERAELRNIVVTSVLNLEEPYRSTLILRFFEEMEVEDIGRLTKTVEDTVRTRIRRGVIRLRELLERDAAIGRATRVTVVRLQWLSSSRDCARLRRAAPERRSSAVSTSHPPSRFGTYSLRLGRHLLVATAIIAVIVGGWWWSRRADSTTERTQVADRAVAPSSQPTSPIPAPAVVTPEPANEVATSETNSAPVPPTPPPAPRALIRGVITARDGTPVAGAHVWALRCGAQRREYSISEFSGARSDSTRRHKSLAIGSVLQPPTTEDMRSLISRPILDGRLAFDATVGAQLSDDQFRPGVP
jgi:RNA polymerase sigma-70 factor (ECF subfamily)